MNRKKLDQEAYNQYINAHESAQATFQGLIQWQGSESQRVLKEDLMNRVHLAMSRAEFRMTLPEYYDYFPLTTFRDKINQEIRTAKYLHTLDVFGKDARKKKKK